MLSDGPAGITIREATYDDWPAIRPFFTEIVADGESYCYALDLTDDEARELWFGDERTVVAVDGSGVLGSAHFGSNRPGGRGRHVGTASFMVAPAARGRGVARMLGEYVVAELAAAGYRGIQFNAVVESNTAAVRLWQSLGFRIVGTVPEAYDSRTHGLVGLHVMYRPLP